MRAEKAQLVKDIRGLLEPSPCVFLATYKGLSVADFANLRKRLADVGAECHVVPNRLLRRAVVDVGVTGVDRLTLTGDTAVVAGGKDVAAVAKAMRAFSKERPVFTFKGGVLGGVVYPGAEMERLATLPPIQVLRAQLLGLLQAPMGQLVGVLNAKVASIVYVLQAYTKQKETVSC